MNFKNKLEFYCFSFSDIHTLFVKKIVHLYSVVSKIYKDETPCKNSHGYLIVFNDGQYLCGKKSGR